MEPTCLSASAGLVHVKVPDHLPLALELFVFLL